MHQRTMAQMPNATRPIASPTPAPDIHSPPTPTEKCRAPGPNATQVNSSASARTMPTAIVAFTRRKARGVPAGKSPLESLAPNTPRTMTINPAPTNMAPISQPIHDGAGSVAGALARGSIPDIAKSGIAPTNTVRMASAMVVLLDGVVLISEVRIPLAAGGDYIGAVNTI